MLCRNKSNLKRDKLNEIKNVTDILKNIIQSNFS